MMPVIGSGKEEYEECSRYLNYVASWWRGDANIVLSMSSKGDNNTQQRCPQSKMLVDSQWQSGRVSVVKNVAALRYLLNLACGVCVMDVCMHAYTHNYLGTWFSSLRARCIPRRELLWGTTITTRFGTWVIVMEPWSHLAPDGTLIWLLIEPSVLVESLSICFGNICDIIQNLYKLSHPWVIIQFFFIEKCIVNSFMQSSKTSLYPLFICLLASHLYVCD